MGVDRTNPSQNPKDPRRSSNAQSKDIDKVDQILPKAIENFGAVDEIFTSLDTGIFNWNPSAISVVENVEQLAKSNSFVNLLKTFEEIVDQVNKSLPVLSHGDTVPQVGILDSSPTISVPSSYKGPIAILIPEIHLRGKGGPHRIAQSVSTPVTPNGIKVANVKILEALFANSDLNKEISSGFNETSLNIQGLGTSAQDALSKPNIDAVDVLEFMLREKGIGIQAAESLQDSIETQLSLAFLTALHRGQETVDIGDLNSLVGAKTQDDFYKTVNQALVALTTRANIQDAITWRDIETLGISSSLNPNSLIQILGQEWIKLNIKREEKIADKFQQSSGLVPMIIGRAHLQTDTYKTKSVKDFLQEKGIPFISIGAKALA